MSRIRNSLLFLVILLGVCSMMWAATIYVPGNHATIQAAIDAANPGDVIQVAAGTYTGAVDITKRISIIGSGMDGASQTIITGGNPAIKISSTGIVGDPILLKDLQILATSSWGVKTNITSIDYLTFENVWIKDATPDTGEGFRLTTGHTLTNWTVSGSVFEGFYDGIIVERTPGENSTWLENVIFSNTQIKDNKRKGFYTETLHNASFSNVTVTGNGNNTPQGSLASENAGGFDINLKDGDYENLLFSNMSFSNNGINARHGCALMVKARGNGDDTSYASYPATLTNVTIDNCTLTGNERGIRFGEPGKNNSSPVGAVISNSTINNNYKTYAIGDGSRYGDIYNALSVPITANGESLPAGLAKWYIEDGMSIQAAINAADSGDVIEVAPGTYTGNVIITKSLTLLSTDGAETTILDGVSTDPGLGTIHVNSGVNNLVIGSIGHGFHVKGIDGPAGNEFAAVYFQGVQDNVTVQGNIIEARGDAGIMGMYGAANTNFTIDSNQFTGKTFVGDNPAGTWFSAQFTLPNVPRQLVVFGGGGGTVNTQNFAFTNNVISGVSGGMSITDNTGNPIDPTPQGNTLVTLDLAGTNTITGNTFSGYSTLAAEALRVRGSGTYIISGNTFNGTYPLNMTAGTSIASVGTARLENALLNNTFTKEVVLRDGANNLKNNAIYTAIGSALYLAASGDIIEVGSGNYEEQLHITTNNLTINGAGKTETTIQSPVVLSASFNTGSNVNKPVVFVDGIDTCTIQNLTVDGMGRGNANYRFQGIGFWNAGGTVDNVDVLNIIDTPFSGAQHGVAVYAYNDDEGPYNIACSNMLIEDYQKNAMALMGVGLTVDLDHITTIGAGPTSTTAQNGIQISYGAGGTITNCSVSNNIYYPPEGGRDWAATGIMLSDCAPVFVTNTIMVDNKPAMYVTDTTLEIEGSQLLNNEVTYSGDAMYYMITGAGSRQSMVISPSPLDETDTYNSGRSSYSLTMDNVDAIGCDKVDSWAYYFYSASGTVPVNMLNSTVSHWDAGIYAHEDGGTLATTINNNQILDNSYGLYAATINPVDATRNYWGSQYGPEHASNPFSGTEGIGNPVSDNVSFMPFYATATTTPETEYVNVLKDNRATFMVYTSDDLALALAAAEAGDDIQLGTFEFVGSFNVPAGVTIEAQDGASPTVTADGGAAFVINGGGVLIDGIAIAGAGDQPAILVAANDVDNPTTIIDCNLNNGTGATLENESGVDALIEGNYWNGDDPADPTIVVGQGSPVVVLEEEEEALPIALYSFAEDTLLKAGETQTYTIKALEAEDLAGYTVRIQLDKTYFLEPESFECGDGFIQEIPFLDDQSSETHWIYDVSAAFDNQVMISGYNVPLFTFETTSLVGPDVAPHYAVEPIELVIDNVALYTVDNGQYNSIECEEVASVEITLDWADPTIDHTNDDVYPSPYLLSVETDGSGDLVLPTLNFTLADNYNQDFSKYLIQAENLVAPELAGFDAADVFAVIDETTTNVASWELPVAGYGDGTYSLYILAVDDAGNHTIFDWDFIVDRTPPEAITWTEGSAACRTTIDANNSIDLAWTNPAGAVKNHIWYFSYADLNEETNAYPVYNPAGFEVPSPPTSPIPYLEEDENGWVKAAEIDAAGTYTHTGMDRGYYYYIIFVEDASGNISVGSEVRESISYWPGDVDSDSAVDVDDIALLAAVWGTDGSGNAECNVGPTVNRLRRGRPLPDNIINIEDLMIFAMNYLNTDYEAYNRTLPELNPIRIEMITEAVDDRLLVHIVLSDNNSFVRALNIPVSYGNDLSLQSVELSSIWPEDSIILYTNNDHVAEISMSGLGMETVLEGNGIVATLSFLIDGSQTETELLTMIARDIENNEIEIVNNPTGGVDNDEEVIVIPAANFLGNAYPNPFNPSTTISYGLTEPQNVKIKVYNVRGQEIRTLVNGMMPAGTYNLIWDGRDDNNRSIASGVYFFRMETGNHQETKKAILMK